MQESSSVYWWVYLAVSAVVVGLVQALKAWDKAGKLKGWYTVLDVVLCGLAGAAMALAGVVPWAGYILAVIVLGFLTTIGYQTFVKPFIDRGVK